MNHKKELLRGLWVENGAMDPYDDPLRSPIVPPISHCQSDLARRRPKGRSKYHESAIGSFLGLSLEGLAGFLWGFQFTLAPSNQC